jgi:predicted MFS family arabinose efflux permease
MNIPGIKNLTSGMLVRTLFGYSVFNFILLSVSSLIPEFSINEIGVGAMMSAYWIPALTLPLIIGKLADRIGEKNLVVAGCLTIALGAFIIGQATFFELILIGRFISGVGAILFWTTGLNLVNKMWENKRISFITALIVLCYGVGTLLAIFFAPIQEFFLGWRSVFIITAIYGLAISITVMILAKNPLENQKESGNMKKVVKNINIFKVAIAQSFSVGAWTSFLTFFSISLIFEKGVEKGLADFTIIIASVAGIIFALIGGYLADKKYKRNLWISIPLLFLAATLFVINIFSGTSFIIDLILSWLVGALVWIPQGSIWSLPKILEPKYPNTAMSILVTITAVSVTLFPLIFGYLVVITSTYLYSFIFLGIMVLIASFISYKIRE